MIQKEAAADVWPDTMSGAGSTSLSLAPPPQAAEAQPLLLVLRWRRSNAGK